MKIYTAQNSVEEFLSATAARQPTPGGGSVAAVAGALAAAIGEMVINYSIGKKDLQAYQTELQSAQHELQRARSMLLMLTSEDQAAFEAFTEIRKLPADAPQRDQKFAAALLTCIRAPQAMAATSLAVLELCDRLVDHVNVYLISDLAVSAELAMATTRCAIYNCLVNLPEVPDVEERESLRSILDQMQQRAVGLVRSVMPKIWERHQRQLEKKQS